MNEILIIGYGNPGRADDGLGVAFADEIEKLNLKNISVDRDYQLAIEHAYDVAESKLTVLFDAHMSCTEPFEIRRICSSASFSFSTHSVSPENLLCLAEEIAKAPKTVFAIGIKGYDFNSFKEGLSEKAKINLRKTLEYMIRILKDSNAEQVCKLLTKNIWRVQS